MAHHYNYKYLYITWYILIYENWKVNIILYLNKIYSKNQKVLFNFNI